MIFEPIGMGMVTTGGSPPGAASFTVATASTSLTVAVSGFSATGIPTHYMCTESATPPSSGDAGWVSAPGPTTFTRSGSVNKYGPIYAWAKNANGVSSVGTPTNVLTFVCAAATITLNSVVNATQYNVTWTYTMATGQDADFTLESGASKYFSGGVLGSTQGLIWNYKVAASQITMTSRIANGSWFHVLTNLDDAYVGGNAVNSYTPELGWHISDYGSDNTYVIDATEYASAGDSTVDATYANWIFTLSTTTLTKQKDGGTVRTDTGTFTINEARLAFRGHFGGGGLNGSDRIEMTALSITGVITVS